MERLNNSRLTKHDEPKKYKLYETIASDLVAECAKHGLNLEAKTMELTDFGDSIYFKHKNSEVTGRLSLEEYKVKTGTNYDLRFYIISPDHEKRYYEEEYYGKKGPLSTGIPYIAERLAHPFERNADYYKSREETRKKLSDAGLENLGRDNYEKDIIALQIAFDGSVSVRFAEPMSAKQAICVYNAYLSTK